MPPRHAYWTIILEGKPTAFRAHTDAELLPTFKQLQSKHPDVVMKWFSRGKLWSSPAEEQAALADARKRRPERRDGAWRPGGSHQDPRERFKVPRDEKRRRFAERMRRDEREGQGPGPDRPARKPHGDRPWRPKPPGPQGFERRGPSGRPGGDRPRGPGGFGGGGRAPGGRGPGGRGPGGRGPGGRGPGGRGPGGRGPGGRGPGGRGPGGGGRGR